MLPHGSGTAGLEEPPDEDPPEEDPPEEDPPEEDPPEEDEDPPDEDPADDPPEEDPEGFSLGDGTMPLVSVEGTIGKCLLRR